MGLEPGLLWTLTIRLTELLLGVADIDAYSDTVAGWCRLFADSASVCQFNKERAVYDSICLQMHYSVHTAKAG